jgi:hypothetical protein
VALRELMECSVGILCGSFYFSSGGQIQNTGRSLGRPVVCTV